MSLYHEAAELLAASPFEAGSLKSRVFGGEGFKSQPQQLYALVLEASKWSAVVKEVVEGTELLKHERKGAAQLTPALSLLLVHDLLLTKVGIALPQSHGLRMSVERHKHRLRSELTRARLRRRAASLEALREQVERAAAGEEANYPRWVRVNMLKSCVEEQLETTFAGYSRACSVWDVVSKAGRQVYVDTHVPSLIAVTPGIDLTKTAAYRLGKIILQDKASCFPAYLLDPHFNDGDVIDACAAPGNKSTHLASIIHDHRPEFTSKLQTIFAFEKDWERAQVLEKMVHVAGSDKMTRIGYGQDFLQVDPHADTFSRVGALLLDPSCSSSGIVARDSMPLLHLPGMPLAGARGANTVKGKRKAWKGGQGNGDTVRDDDGNELVVRSKKNVKSRLEALSTFQLRLLLHAFKFPAASKVTYSTCSEHAEENEKVVMAALRSDVARRCGWHILERKRQVRGMREWPVRGLVEACDGDATIADGCIRTYKGDGRGVMGFFVAGFARDPTTETEAEGRAAERPYVRDEGRIVRDILGMPTLKATGETIQLVSNEKEEQVDGEGEGAGDKGEDDKRGGDDDCSEWNGLGD